MTCCPYFKNGYFAVCIASGSNHIPSIAEMEQYCFRDHLLCPAFDLGSEKIPLKAPAEMKTLGSAMSTNASDK